MPDTEHPAIQERAQVQQKLLFVRLVIAGVDDESFKRGVVVHTFLLENKGLR
jgi:hypothetical protein